VSKNSFEKIGGYDDVLEGWGGEDEDLYLRLSSIETLIEYFPHFYYEAIQHSDQERTSFYTIKDKDIQNEINLVYGQIKKIAMTNLKMQDLPLEGRIEIMRQATKARDSGQGRVSITMPRKKIPKEKKLSIKLIIDFSLD